MRSTQIVGLSITLLTVTLFSCQNRDERAATECVCTCHVEAVTVDNAVACAVRVFLRTGARLDDYKVKVLDNHLEDRWTVKFELDIHPSPPGGGFWVFVDKKTGVPELIATD
jgi:hypothetical protein